MAGSITSVCLMCYMFYVDHGAERMEKCLLNVIITLWIVTSLVMLGAIIWSFVRYSQIEAKEV